MLKKKNRLTWKDINFLIKKQNMIYWKYFSFFYFKQYPNRYYNQYSLQLPIKLSKKAVYRNFVKRVVFDYINSTWLINKRFNSSYYKIFIIFNKKEIEKLKETIETKEKKLIKDTIIKNFRFSFNNLINKLWK